MEYWAEQRILNRSSNGQKILKVMFSFLSNQGNTNQNIFGMPSYTCQNGWNQRHQWYPMLERMWSKRTLILFWWEYKLVQPLWKSVWQFLRKLGVKLPQDQVIPLLGIYSRDAHSYYKSICSTMFIAVLFLIARTWKKPRCPSLEEWIKKVWHIYTLEYYSAVKKQWYLEFCMQINGNEKYYPEWDNPDPKRWMWFVLTH